MREIQQAGARSITATKTEPHLITITKEMGQGISHVAHSHVTIVEAWVTLLDSASGALKEVMKN